MNIANVYPRPKNRKFKSSSIELENKIKKKKRTSQRAIELEMLKLDSP